MLDNTAGAAAEFQDLRDACALMGEIAGSLSPEDIFYGDFKFFRAVNCTTQSEYREALKSFLESLLSGPLPAALRKFAPRLTVLCRWL